MKAVCLSLTASRNSTWLWKLSLRLVTFSRITWENNDWLHGNIHLNYIVHSMQTTKYILQVMQKSYQVRSSHSSWSGSRRKTYLFCFCFMGRSMKNVLFIRIENNASIRKRPSPVFRINPSDKIMNSFFFLSVEWTFRGISSSLQQSFFGYFTFYFQGFSSTLVTFFYYCTWLTTTTTDVWQPHDPSTTVKPSVRL